MTTTKRISVPPEAVRTPEAILAGEYVRNGYVWLTCHNCGGSGSYPSSMTPPGRCRFYCWAAKQDALSAALGAEPPSKSPSDPTFGKRAMTVDKYVKREQAHDRREYRAAAKWEAERPEREAREREELKAAEIEAYRLRREAEEREAYEMDRMRVSRHVGEIGTRLVGLKVRAVDSRTFEGGMYGPRRLVRFRDAEGNVLIWWTGTAAIRKGAEVTVRATVKKHSEYNGERQTEVTRVKVEAI